jgi:hypothetical protein
MPGSRIPAPTGAAPDAPPIDAGTSPVTAMPAPSPVGGGAAAGPAATDAAALDARIEALDLATTARAAAYALKKAHPAIRFTSGRRSKQDQARAMSGNVIRNRQWIVETYADSPLRAKCQDWVDSNPDKTSAADIAAGLLSVFNTVDDAALGKFSKHLSGEAFDVQPVDKDADAIKKTIRGLAGLDKFLDTEGGLVRWHAQF